MEENAEALKEQFKVKYQRLAKNVAVFYWDLGKVAHALKMGMAHGAWEDWLEQNGYVARTVRRALRIYRLHKASKDEVRGLTLEEAGKPRATSTTQAPKPPTKKQKILALFSEAEAEAPNNEQVEAWEKFSESFADEVSALKAAFFFARSILQ